MALNFKKLQDKHVLVIGGTSGIGYAVAAGSLEAGARVTVSSSNPTRVATTVDKLKAAFPTATVAGYVCDLSQPTVEKDLEALFAQVGTLDHLVYTAGDKLHTGAVADMTYESLLAAGQVRFLAAALAVKVGHRYLTPGPFSSITLTTGLVGQKPRPNWTEITGFATGLEGLTRALALDLKPIRVNLVSPGAVATELWDTFLDDDAARRAMEEGLEQALPTGRVAQAEDCAEAYLWLMKDASVTGTMVNSNSGALLV